jgi:hypothetical protein
MRTVLQQLAENPPLTAKAVIERFRGLSAESRTPELQWELLNQARAGLHDWVAGRSGVHALRGSAVEPADAAIALRLRAAATLEQAIDGQVERQLHVAGYALGLFRHLSGQPGDVAEDTAIRWAGMAVRLDSATARESAHLKMGAATPAHGTVTPGRETSRTSNPAVRPLPLITGSPGRSRSASLIAAEFPCAALTPDRRTNVVPLDPAQRRARLGPMPRPRR